MSKIPKKLFDTIFKTNEGKVVIGQMPNALICTWIALKALQLGLHTSTLKSGVAILSSAVLFTWAYLELTQGVNYFRKGLGFVVLFVVTLGFFR